MDYHPRKRSLPIAIQKPKLSPQYEKDARSTFPNYHHHPDHHPDARSIDLTNLIITELDLILANALESLHPILDSYRTSSLSESMNWSSIHALLPPLATKSWYVVVFRSIRKKDVNRKDLYDADHAAHMEAKESGGILGYWYGDVDKENRCLAMCIWANR